MTMADDPTSQDISAGPEGKEVEIPDSVRGLIATGPYAHLITLNEDGSPQVTVVWVGIEGNEFVCGHMFPTHKTDNIRRDPRVALSILGQGMNPIGLKERLAVYGQARVVEGGAVALLSRLAPAYLGPGVEYPPEQLRNQPGFVTHIRPERITGIGPWGKRMF